MRLYNSLRLVSILSLLVTLVPKINSSAYINQAEKYNKTLTHEAARAPLETATPSFSATPSATQTLISTATPTFMPTLTPTFTPTPIPDYICEKTSNEFSLFQYTGSIDNKVLPLEELQFPIEKKYVPGWIRGYFESHPAIDIVFSVGFNYGVPILPPSKIATLVATAENVSAPLSDNINMSGTIEFYHVFLETENEIKPYIFVYSHLKTGSMHQAMEEAKLNNGHTTFAGEIGHTGWTDGWHLHVNIIDLTMLYDLTGTHSPNDAIYALLNAKDKSLLPAYQDPQKFYSFVQKYNFIPEEKYKEIQSKGTPGKLPVHFTEKTIVNCGN